MNDLRSVNCPVCGELVEYTGEHMTYGGQQSCIDWLKKENARLKKESKQNDSEIASVVRECIAQTKVVIAENARLSKENEEFKRGIEVAGKDIKYLEQELRETAREAQMEIRQAKGMNMWDDR